MKKTISILLAAVMLCAFACAACAEDAVPQPEGGKKFEHDWAIPGGLVQIYYEEQGYRVSVDIEKPEAAAGTLWEYSCYYQEDTDSLLSVSSIRTDYTVNPDNGEKEYKASAYDDMDDEHNSTVFTIRDGRLIWQDGREDAGAGIEFTDIGRFEGVWRNEKEETEAEFMWDGTDADHMRYTVYIVRGVEGADHYASFLMNGEYDPATGKLTAEGTCTLFTKNAEGEYDIEDDGETYDAIFSQMEDGRLLYETANGIELEYDIMGNTSQG